MAAGKAVTLGASGTVNVAKASATDCWRSPAAASASVTFGWHDPGQRQHAVTGGSITAGGDATLTGVTLALRDASAGQKLALRATGGDMTLSGTGTGGTVQLDASGRLALGSVRSTGELVANGGAGVNFASLSGAAVTATSAGGIAGDAMEAIGSLAVTGAAVTLRGVTAGQGATIRATGGDLALSTLKTGGDASLTASGRAAITGAVATGGAYRVTGGSVVLGDTPGVSQRANGEVRITSLSGDISGVAGLTLASDADASAGAEALILDSAGGIAMAGTLLQARPGGGAALGLRAGAGRTVTLGDVEAGSIGGFDGIRVAGPFTGSGLVHRRRCGDGLT